MKKDYLRKTVAFGFVAMMHLLSNYFDLRIRSFIVKPCPHTHVGACYKVACYKVSPCDFVARYDFVACDFVASSLTRAAFYQISTDSVLALSVEIW